MEGSDFMREIKINRMDRFMGQDIFINKLTILNNKIVLYVYKEKENMLFYHDNPYYDFHNLNNELNSAIFDKCKFNINGYEYISKACNQQILELDSKERNGCKWNEVVIEEIVCEFDENAITANEISNIYILGEELVYEKIDINLELNIDEKIDELVMFNHNDGNYELIIHKVESVSLDRFDTKDLQGKKILSLVIEHGKWCKDIIVRVKKQDECNYAIGVIGGDLTVIEQDNIINRISLGIVEDNLESINIDIDTIIIKCNQESKLFLI
ncbi:hypothetical protein [Wukongibacter sp. M2B1]|uniref:hypothetical protein n=1 Tax=Wukongibacter sp. M2B1 TaxID=3088895 RepID=UPI003D7B4419